jgi:hypothetical protein
MSRVVLPVGMVALLLLACSTLLAEDNRSNNNNHTERHRIERGFKIAPVPLHFNRKNWALVGLGSYIVNAQGGCNDCHTNPPYSDGGDPHLGQPEKINAEHYLAGGTLFGPFVSRNITPDPDTGLPAELTFKGFKKVMRTGVDPDQEHPEISPLLQVMPWPVYGKMSDHDLRAIYEYLKAIPHAEPAAPAAAARQP